MGAEEARCDRLISEKAICWLRELQGSDRKANEAQRHEELGSPHEEDVEKQTISNWTGTVDKSRA